MFSNLSQREKLLAVISIGFLSVVVLVGGVYLFNSMITSRRAAISRLENQKQKLFEDQRAAEEMAERRERYRQASFPRDVERAELTYRDWIREIARDTGLRIESQDRENPSEVRYGSSRALLFTSIGYRINATGTYRQFVDFLQQFYSVPAAHRISELRMQRLSAEGSSEPQLSFAMLVEAMSLVDAEPDNNPLKPDLSLLARTPEEYYETITRRRLFGPPNRAPELRAVGRTNVSVSTHEPIDLEFQGTDADDDVLKFELRYHNLRGDGDVRLQQDDPGSRTVRVIAPTQRPGNYQVTVRVSDDGFPSLWDEVTVAIEVKAPEIADWPPRPPQYNPPQPSPPPVIFAEETYVIGLLGIRRGDSQTWIAQIYDRMRGRTHDLTEGDSFTLDNDVWTVLQVDRTHVVLETNGVARPFSLGDRLSEPLYSPGEWTTAMDRDDEDFNSSANRRNPDPPALRDRGQRGGDILGQGQAQNLPERFRDNQQRGGERRGRSNEPPGTQQRRGGRGFGGFGGGAGGGGGGGE